jgi:hypothetical protein
MPRRNKPPTPPARRPWRAVAAVAVTLVVVAGIVFALGYFGDEALRRVGARDRYRTTFADIVCDTPPGLDRPTFLTEVRYVGALPDSFNALDPADRERVVAGFAKHPWVESVDGATVKPGGEVRIGLRFRSPVLAVTTTDRAPRLLDRHGVLLPVAPTPPGAAELVGAIPPPTVAAGDVWPHADVRSAVELTTAYGAKRLEKTLAGWKLTLPDGKHIVVGR